MHFFGALAMCWEVSRPIFLALTPLNLLLSAAGLLFFQDRKNYGQFLKYFGTIALLGYLVEVAGVQTGAIFGQYTYGTPLGPKLWDVPPLIGLNWAILVVLVGRWVVRLRWNPWLASSLSALLLVLMDVLIEPVAISLGWWTWAQESVPLQNYAAWYVIAWAFAWLYFRARLPAGNPFANALLAGQLIFFVLYNLLGR